MPYEIEGDLLCWVWTGRTTADGTPEIRTRHGHTTARRYYWEREHEKPVPEGKILFAYCGDPLCVRPRHCEPVTPAEFQYRIGRSALDPHLAGLALLMRRSGASQHEVGEHFNVDPGTVRRIERGEHWTQRKGARKSTLMTRRK